MLLSFALYGRVLDAPFLFDDTHNLLKNPAIRVVELTPGALLEAGRGSFGVGGNRPVAFYTFAVNYFVGGLDPSGYRAVNLVIHGLAAALVFALAATVLRRATGRAPPAALPLLAALLWVVHPVQTNAVAYVVQRMTSLATLAYLGGLLCYLRARARTSTAWAWAAGSAACFALACFTKEIAFVFPLALLLYEVAFSRRLRDLLAGRPWIVVLGLAALLALFPLALLHYGEGYRYFRFDWQQRVMTEWRVVAHYLGLLALPHPSRLILDYDFPLSHGLLAPATTLASLLLHLGLLSLGGWALVRRPLYGFCLLGFYLHLVIESTVIPLDLVFEHRLYLPSVFLVVGVTAGAWELSGAFRARRRAALGLGVAGMCVAAV